MARFSLSEMTKQCDRFNERVPIGTNVLVWGGIKGIGPGKPGTVIEPGAYILSGHTAVCQVSPGGAYALTHIEVAVEQEPLPLFEAA